jgi:hypothetical protein
MEITKENLKNELKQNILVINFKKKDDTTRKMFCTLKADYLPEAKLTEEDKEKKEKAENLNVLPVWDLEKKAWRAFRVDSIIDWSVDNEYQVS